MSECVSEHEWHEHDYERENQANVYREIMSMTRSMNLNRPMVRFADRQTDRQSIGRIVDRMRERANVSLVTEIEETAEKTRTSSPKHSIRTKGRKKSGEEEGRK